MDPADVRKVALEEAPGNRPLSDEIVSRARNSLFVSVRANPRLTSADVSEPRRQG
jgi:hypothetical protein